MCHKQEALPLGTIPPPSMTGLDGVELDGRRAPFFPLPAPEARISGTPTVQKIGYRILAGSVNEYVLVALPCDESAPVVSDGNAAWSMDRSAP